MKDKVQVIPKDFEAIFEIFFLKNKNMLLNLRYTKLEEVKLTETGEFHAFN